MRKSYKDFLLRVQPHSLAPVVALVQDPVAAVPMVDDAEAR